jgi:anaerobic selenocysteine-containing dehydrogenase
VRPEVVILTEIARRLLPGSPVPFAAFQQHKTIREAIAKIVPGMEDLADIDVAKHEFHVRGRIMHAPSFKTPDGKAQFVTRPIPAAPDGSLLLTTVRSEGQFNTIIYQRKDVYRGDAERWSVMMNAEDMEAHGLAEGDEVALESEHGRMEGVKVRAFDIAKGAAMAYYPEANVLTGAAVDPRSRTPAFKSTPVRVVRAGAP